MRTETIILQAAVFIIACGTVAVALKHIKNRGAISLIVLAASLVIWMGAYWEVVGRLLSNMGRSLTLYMQFCLLIAASAQFAFSLSAVSNVSLKLRSFLILAIAPLAAALRLFIEPLLPVRDISINLLMAVNAWDSLVSIYACVLGGASMAVLIVVYFDAPKSYRRGLLAITLLSSTPYFGQLLDFREYNILPFTFSLPAYTLAAIGIGCELIYQRFAETISYIRKNVFDAQVDGLVIVNQQNAILDINAAAEKILGRTREQVVGKFTAEALGSIPGFEKSLFEVVEFERKRRPGIQGEWQYLSIRISPVLDINAHAVGRLLTWRDYSKKRRAEDARQKAREEMFVLINAISGIARDSTNLEEFLTNAIYHIVYPFRSQCAIVFLESERNPDGPENKYHLAAHFGFDSESLKKLIKAPTLSSFFKQALIDQQPLLIENVPNEEGIPDEIKQEGLEQILVMPLITHLGEENRVLGCICIGSKANYVYSDDNVIRLTAICDHIASLIDNERRRKLSIALSERKGLLRDLHDSVSQKLYGLVTLTEAAQAALDAGNSLDPSQVLFRIGENARQAVREMRLFLYQMQPPDLDKEGLISIIHHRLSAVEGRSDIKARLLADEYVELSKDNEIELYYIAQEALNNILRHAYAKSITVKLKQGKRNVIFEIQDDGRGFDPKKLDRSGYGLANMKERAHKINGKMKITSKTGEGTRLVVSFPRDHIINRAQKE